MSERFKRMRMFGGPNGSGKSTIFERIRQKVDIGHYLNSDEIEKSLRQKGFIDLSDYGICVDPKEFEAYYKSSSLHQKSEEAGLLIDILFCDNILVNKAKHTHSYEAAFIGEFIRQQLLKSGQSFSLETVMSHPSKIDLLKQAQSLGYKSYLYYICTESPIINIERVKIRVAKGGHPVPKSKIESRYFRSLKQLPDAVKNAHRAYIFDNTQVGTANLVLEVYQGRQITFHQDRLPQWLDRYLLDKLM